MSPYIEVLASVVAEREIECYEVSLELSTSAGKQVACVDRAVALREAIISILKQSGFAESDLREGGGHASQSSWSSKKFFVHRIAVRHKNMETLMSAMAATERHFAAMPRSIFGGAKHSFTFHDPVPIYSTHVSADDALRNALDHARQSAEVIATEAGYRLGQILSVVEIDAARRGNSQSPLRYGEPFDGEMMDYWMGVAKGTNASYSPLPPNRERASRRLRVRFALEGVERET